jgi:hypothetical protein
LFSKQKTPLGKAEQGHKKYIKIKPPESCQAGEEACNKDDFHPCQVEVISSVHRLNKPNGLGRLHCLRSCLEMGGWLTLGIREAGQRKKTIQGSTHHQQCAVGKCHSHPDIHP